MEKRSLLGSALSSIIAGKKSGSSNAGAGERGSNKGSNSVAGASVLRSEASKVTADEEEDFEAYVASIIAREAKEAEKKYQREGISAYIGLDRHKMLPKPNKRFLANIVRATDDHNQTLLRQIAEESNERLKNLDRDSIDRWRSSFERDERSRSPRKRRRSLSLHERSSRRDRERSESLEHQRNRATGTPPREEPGSASEEAQTQITANQQESPGGAESSSDSSSGSSEEGELPTINSAATAAPIIREKRGRGGVGPSRLDKVFDSNYVPQLDFDNYDETNMHHYIEALEDLRDKAGGSAATTKLKKSKKVKSSKKEKKRKKDKSSSKNKKKKKKTKD